MAVTGEQACIKCATTKPLSLFPRDPRYERGVKGICKECHAATVRDYYARNPHKRREHGLNRNRRGRPRLTIEDYNRQLAQQAGRCAICGLPEAENRDGCLHYDHDHATGEMRGLLCNKCNQGLGLFRDSTNRLRAAADYLEEYR